MMDALKRVFAVILGLCAVAVAGHYILSPLYTNSARAALALGYYLDILMAVSLLIALAFQGQSRRAANAAAGGAGKGLSREKLAANALFYVTLLVALWFFRNWFDLLTANPPGSQSIATQMVWDLIDGLLPILLGITAIRLWRNSNAAGRRG